MRGSKDWARANESTSRPAPRRAPAPSVHQRGHQQHTHRTITPLPHGRAQRQGAIRSTDERLSFFNFTLFAPLNLGQMKREERDEFRTSTFVYWVHPGTPAFNTVRPDFRFGTSPKHLPYSTPESSRAKGLVPRHLARQHGCSGGPTVRIEIQYNIPGYNLLVLLFIAHDILSLFVFQSSRLRTFANAPTHSSFSTPLAVNQSRSFSAAAIALSEPLL